MGDCGSLFIGALLAAASLVPVYNAPLAFINPLVIVVLVLIVPIFDTGFVLVLRRLAGRKRPKAAPITCRTGWCRSAFRSGAPSGSCTCLAWSEAAARGC